MNWEEKFELLANLARNEASPKVDVSYAVIDVLTRGEAAPLAVSERLWMWLAAGASAVAGAATVVAVSVYNAGTGPLREMMDSISWAM